MIRQLTISLLIVSVCFSMQSINKIIGNKGFEIKYGRSPNEYDNQKDEIISHFEFVYDSLSNLKSEDLNKLQLTNRTKHLNSLKKYMTRGIFPLNNLYFDRVPVFVDELNTHCAVAYILKEDNQFEIINNLQQNYNYNYVEDMNLDTLSFWLQNSGLSLDELKLIQPTYPGQHPKPVSSLFSQIAPYISLGTNISLNNKNGIRGGFEITGGILAGPLHLKMSYGKKHFRNLTQFINYYTFGGGLAIIGYERGFAKLTDGQNKIIEGKRSNIYIGGLIYPIAVAWDITGMVQAGILPTNFYSREKFVFSDTTYVNHNIWQKFAIPMTDCLMCN